jgi:hypothetical protein
MLRSLGCEILRWMELIQGGIHSNMCWDEKLLECFSCWFHYQDLILIFSNELELFTFPNSFIAMPLILVTGHLKLVF